MNKDFEKLAKALSDKGIKCTLVLSKPFNKGEVIDVIVGMDAPDSLLDKVDDVMEDVGVMAGMCGDMSGPEEIEKRRINGGAKNYW